MSRKKNLFVSLILRMMFYGVLLGALAGFLVSVSLLLTQGGLSTSNIVDTILGTLYLSSVFGGGFGALFGGFGGLFSGIVMAFVTAIAFGEIRNARTYKYTMGVMTFIVTGLVFVAGDFNTLAVTDQPTWLMVALLSILIAVAASQRAANKYLREIDMRKIKEKLS